MAKEQKIGFQILNLSVSEDSKVWQLKIKSAGISEAKAGYGVAIVVNDNFFDRQVKDCKNQIASIEAKPDMFEDYKTSIKSLNDNIKGIESERKDFKKLEIDEFDAECASVDFNKGVLVLEIPEDVITDIVKIRLNIEKFNAVLK